MVRECRLTLRNQDTGENASVTGRFPCEDWERLENFVQYADDLLNVKLVRDGMLASLTLHWEEATGLLVATQLPPWDDVAVFLHRFRPIGLESESTFFYKVCSILTKELPHPLIRSMIGEERETYGGTRLQARFRMRSNDVLLNSERVLKDWLNAFEYHRNREKRGHIESLYSVLPLDALRVVFLALLAEKAQAIHNVAALTRVVLGMQQSVEGRVLRQG